MKIINLVDSLIEKLESGMIIFFSIIIILTSFAQVILRNLFSSGISGADHMLRHMVFWIALLGASILTRESRHIKIDILSRVFRGKSKIINHLVVNLISLAICLLLVFAGIKFVGVEMSFNEKSPILLPIWSLQLIMPIAFSIISFRFLIKTIESSIELFK